MQVSTGAVLQIITTLLVFVLTVIVSVIGWYIRRYIISEVEKNSQFRKWLAGTEFEADDGFIAELEALHDEMSEQHVENRQKLEYTMRYVKRIAEAIEQNVDEPPRKWTGDD
jgi:hypothetical protein